ncbi:MAG: hypothetical protein E7163_01965 [Firmicutes bacterium]|nr:hypothetical protein [Bacillota bacterium]
MKKNNALLICWGFIVVVLVGLLAFLGFVLKSKNSDYVKLENKLLDSTKKYVDAKFLYPEDGKKTKITSEELIESDYLDALVFEDDKCTGYVEVTKSGVYKYDVYIKCNNYKTKGY